MTTTKQKAKVVVKKGLDIAKEKGAAAAKNTGKAIKENPKTALYIGLGIIGVLVVYQFTKKSSDAVNKLLNGDPNIDDTVLLSPGDLNTDQSRLTITQGQARIFAQQLLDAMNAKQPIWGTDEETILAIFKKINSEDFKLIFSAFGKKDYNGNNSPPQGIFSNLDGYEPRDLVYWLNSELDFFDGEVFSVVKEVVENAGFVFA